MTRIDFYVLPETDSEAQLRFTCRLIEKAWRLGNQVFVATRDEVQASALDQLLWTFRPDSFVPHQCIQTSSNDCPVEIGDPEDCGDHHDLLINLSDKVPLYFSRFQRLAEVVCQQPDALHISRQHFAYYRDRGYPIQSNTIQSRS